MVASVAGVEVIGEDREKEDVLRCTIGDDGGDDIEVDVTEKDGPSQAPIQRCGIPRISRKAEIE